MLRSLTLNHCTYLSRELLHLSWDREVVDKEVWSSAFHKANDLLEGQRLVVRHEQVSDVVAPDVALSAHGHVSQVKSRHCVFGWAVGLHILGEECVALTLRSKPGCELSLRHSCSGLLQVHVLCSFHLSTFNLKLAVGI